MLLVGVVDGADFGFARPVDTPHVGQIQRRGMRVIGGRAQHPCTARAHCSHVTSRAVSPLLPVEVIVTGAAAAVAAVVAVIVLVVVLVVVVLLALLLLVPLPTPTMFQHPDGPFVWVPPQTKQCGFPVAFDMQS